MSLLLRIVRWGESEEAPWPSRARFHFERCLRRVPPVGGIVRLPTGSGSGQPSHFPAPAAGGEAQSPAGSRRGKAVSDQAVSIAGGEVPFGARGVTMADYHINVFWSDEDGCYVADIPDLAYCSAFGDTPEK